MHAILLAAPVVDIDGTFFIQGGIFLVLVVVLKPLLFTPWLAAQERRRDAISGALDRAKNLRTDADSLASEYDSELVQARERGHVLRSKARRDEEAEQQKALGLARSKAADHLAAERERIDREATAARSALAERIEELAGQIVGKVMGRAG